MSDEEARLYEWRVLEAIDPQAARSSVREWSYDRYPLYRQPDWFDAATLAGPGGVGSGERAAPRRRREVPITDERASRERIVARENPADEGEGIPRERVRGRDDELP